MATPHSFRKGEKVLAYHGILLYDAKILKVELRTNPHTSEQQPYYFIHYQGWKDRWNEWVPGDRMLPHNEANKTKQRRLKEEVNGQAESSTNSAGTKRKRKEPEKPIPLSIPEVLKQRLVKTDIQIRESYLMELPTKPTMGEILEEYTGTLESTTFDEVLENLKLYFDNSLGISLLYKFERPQYNQLRSDEAFKDVPLHQVYGMDHLLRLLIKIPEELSGVKMEPGASMLIHQRVQGLLDFLAENEDSYVATFRAAPQEYIRSARC